MYVIYYSSARVWLLSGGIAETLIRGNFIKLP